MGYFSADFHNHATMYLMAKVFEAHDPKRFKVYAYSFGPDHNDEMRQRLVKAVDIFKDVKAKSDKEIAKLAQKDKIDIAVDLKGYTQLARPGIFSYRAAPIQISYLGYPGTMGADFYDYIIADKIIIPEEQKRNYSENIIYLPSCYMPQDSSRLISDKPLTRQNFNLPENGFVFCSFNNSFKITPKEFDIWMRLLSKIDGSVLWLLKANKSSEDNLRIEAKKRGVEPNRLIFADKIAVEEHLARQRLADLFLDTFPYTAHSTCSDVLRIGLPVLTCMGESFTSRVSASFLHTMMIPELITTSYEEYEKLANKIANDKDLSLIHI